MAIPPFPSEELAKLVLGYLAEEQLMTAYDEFLQKSPYLDAMRNEYDRIFMTSLKTILAEYRAVKIYVETCKPFLLRKKLLQCANLLEIMRFLVNHIDICKLSNKETMQKNSSEKFHKTAMFPVCDVCNSLKLSNCLCKSNHQQVSNYLSINLVENVSLANLVETTSLADLPGSHIKKRQTVQGTECTLTQSYSTCLMSEQSSMQSHGENNFSMPIIEDSPKPLQMNLGLNTTVSGSHVTEATQKVEFNDILSSVCKTNTVRDKRRSKVGNSTTFGKGTTDSFQDFASGVTGYQNPIAPDSSTSENINLQVNTHNKNCANLMASSQPQLLFKVETVRNNLMTQDNVVSNGINNNNPYARHKPADQKITILSDVKVDNSYKGKDKKNKLQINNAASTPLMKMQSIVINGKPAFKTQPIRTYQQTFSKDEIMAMPTIIVVPSSDTYQIPTITQAQHVTSETMTSTMRTQTNTSNKLLSPLVIDITQTSMNETALEVDPNKGITNNENNIGLIKTADIPVDLKKSAEPNCSLPKDIATSSGETNTPPIVPLGKKSSSTPRRTSHIRVLDFTTPRRILHDAIGEHYCYDSNAEPLEVVTTDSSITKSISVTTLGENNKLKNISCSNKFNTIEKSDKIAKPVSTVKSTWDSKLRAMIAASSNLYESSTGSNDFNMNKNNESGNKKDQKKKKTPKNKKVKKKAVSDVDDTFAQNKKVEAVPIKPTINIKSGGDWISSSYADKTQSETKTDLNEKKMLDDDHIETPEVDRVSLQNVMGAKLNISELLETPYKQALYDIQMETPRCLGLELPGEPMSDIKIMNIPTPRFFDTPKIIATTPSYLSRPTDYSSGSSYYKPDDQDLIPNTDLKPIDKPSEKDIKLDSIIEYPLSDRKHSRPVRKCAKNVSYYNISKMKDSDDKTDAASSSSDSINPIIHENKNVKVNSKDKPNETRKSDDKKKSSKKRKTVNIKENNKSFMKIKPRRITPRKESFTARIRKKTILCSPKPQRKRTTSREKNTYTTPAECSIPTKSRRKSSTPRKLNCSKNFNSETHVSPEVKEKQNMIQEEEKLSTHESDAEQLTLQWSEDRSQDAKTNEAQTNTAHDGDDITKIQEYIKTSIGKEQTTENNSDFQKDMITRGFDLETAKIIERDLLDTPPHEGVIDKTVLESPINSIDAQKSNILEKSLETDSSITNELHIDHCEEDDEIELSSHECNEEKSNFILFEYDDTKETLARQPITLKDNFTMEVCIDDDVTIRLRATSFSLLFDHENSEEENICNTKDTEEVTPLVTNMDILNTPQKDSIKSQVYDIFDSTLTSIDTPLKVNSPKNTNREIIINTIVLEEEESNSSEKVEHQRRKRYQSDEPDETPRHNKKSKSDTQYLLSTTHIQDIDIETVLTKLHGP